MRSGNAKLRELGHKIHRLAPSETDLGGAYGEGKAGQKALKHIIDKKKFVIPGVPYTEEYLNSHYSFPKKNTHVISNKTNDALQRLSSSKLTEAKMFKAIGKTEALSKLLKQKRKGKVFKTY
jgi:hypothetical protein